VTLAENPAIRADDVTAGLFVHLGRHVAAVMTDHAPLGVLDSSDTVAHQLEGPPELITLGKLLSARGAASFDLLRTPPRVERVDMLIGGDVMLGRRVGEQIVKGVDPFAGIQKLLASAEQNVMNLECVISGMGEAAPGRKFHLRAPPAAVGAIASAGFGTVSMANNHTADFGNEGVLDSIAQLQASGTTAIGAGQTSEDAYAPRIVTIKDHRVAVLAVNDLPEDLMSGAEIATTSDRERLSVAITAVRGEADFVVMLVHWGEENSSTVTSRQRELARWLIDQGVDLIAGSHPHCLQPLDFYRGRPIAYSLGNLVFDGVPSLPAWNRGALLSVAFEERNRSPAVRLVPVTLDERGFPRATTARAVAQERRR
jgi:poly-gamma-glutamate capsule biosynthesis protein CapA/YwtB (metallophosphatase superfamily)